MPTNPDFTTIDPQQLKRLLKSLLVAAAISAFHCVVFRYYDPDLPSHLRWLRYLAIPFLAAGLPGWSVLWMTYVVGVLRLGIIFVFNFAFYAVLIFGTWEIIRYGYSLKSLRPATGLLSLVILMIFVGVFNSGDKFIVVNGNLMPNYPGWPIYIFGLFVALAAGFNARKGWLYLLPYLCVPIPVLVDSPPFLHALTGSIF